LDYVFTRHLLRNPELKSLGAASQAEETQSRFSLSANPLENSMPINVSAIPLFYLVIDDFKPGILWDLMVLLGMLLFTLGWLSFFQQQKWNLLTTPLALIIWIIAEWAFHKGWLVWNLKSTSFFALEVYSSSAFFPNLGIMLLNSVLLYYFFHWLLKCVQHFGGRLPLWFKKIMTAPGLLLLFFAGIRIIDETAHLVQDSSINFNFHEIHLVNLLTLPGLVAIVLWYLGFFRLFQIVQYFSAHLNLSFRRWITGSVFLFFLAWMLVYRPMWQVWFSGILFLSLLGYELIFKAHKNWVRVGLKLLIPCLITGMVFNRQIAVKELEVRELLAAKLLLQNEREPYNLLSKTENQLMADKGVVDYYTCKDETKSEFEKRLRQLYFSEFSEDFEILVFDYNPQGKGYREENPFEFQAINQLFYSQVCKPLTGRFSIVNERKLKGSYLGRFEVRDGDNFYGTYFLLLKPRISAIQGRLSDMFNRSPLESIFSENQYSYAIYSENKLSRRLGQFNYPVNFPRWGKDSLIKKGGFSHFTYSDDLGNVIVISKPAGKWLDSLSGFTVLGIVSIFLALIYYLVILVRQYILVNKTSTVARMRVLNVLRSRLPLPTGRDLFLSSKLQVYMTLVVFLTFLVVLFVTINYFRNNHSLRQRESLWNKSNEIANAIGTQANLDALFNKYQTALIYDLSNYYNTDINLYDARGKLLVSSNDRIYEQDILGNLMNPYAYSDLNSGSSGFIMDEDMGDLNYISAYYTLFDNDLNVMGYLNLPYFSNRKDLYREISYYAVTIINLFALVFALAAIISYIVAHRITEPLNLIRQQMGLVKIGLPNSPIEWQHNDEIGLLIKQYNKMILELEESTNKLAEGERQGAWREMAKQVAHEIKNPLTPMKLSLQHLQFAIQRNDPHLQDKVSKTIELLIHQIDTLSTMAEEFSSFAKMPEARLEKVNVTGVLEKVVGLFSGEHNLSITFSPPSEPIEILADMGQLTRVFTNIMKNAIQAIPEDRPGRIKITCELKNTRVIIDFHDNGRGIPVELHNKIFSPNFSTKNSGMGLGLAMCKKMIEQFNGNISFYSTVDAGTVFSISLPKFNGEV
jgi:signal transduction histidine kinase